MNRILFLIFVLILILDYNCISETRGGDTSGVNDTVRLVPSRLLIVGGGATAILITAHLQNYNSWWKGTLGSFHLSVDDAPPLGADKCGHFLFSYYSADLLGRSLRWSGIEPLRAAIYGSAFAFTLQLYVEIEDGFHPDIGFSFGDITANTLGSAYAFLQQKYPALNAVSPKWSASPSTRYLRHEYRTIWDDYESQNYWLSFNLNDLTGNRLPSFFPSFLNIAVGYGVTNLDLKGSGDREIYLSLDIDVTKLPGNGDFLASLKHILNYVHFPAPTVRLTPTIIGYGLRF
jgi:hypothetical protein